MQHKNWRLSIAAKNLVQLMHIVFMCPLHVYIKHSEEFMVVEYSTTIINMDA